MINFFSVSIKLSLDIPPDACSCPPPLKYLEANILTLKSPLDLNEIFINPSSFFSINRTDKQLYVFKKLAQSLTYSMATSVNIYYSTKVPGFLGYYYNTRRIKTYELKKSH